MHESARKSNSVSFACSTNKAATQSTKAYKSIDYTHKIILLFDLWIPINFLWDILGKLLRGNFTLLHLKYLSSDSH